MLDSESKNNTIGICILAAGSSSRMEKIKQLLPWAKTTLLGNVIAQAKQINSNILVVLGANASLIKSTLSTKINTTVALDWEQGMGSSLAHGIKVMTKEKQYDAILVLLADQPLLTATHLNTMLARHNESKNKITATLYGDKNGVPAIFHHSVFKELEILNADYGAKKVLAKYKDSINSVNPDEKTLDVDTFETYTELKSKYDLT